MQQHIRDAEIAAQFALDCDSSGKRRSTRLAQKDNMKGMPSRTFSAKRIDNIRSRETTSCCTSRSFKVRSNGQVFCRPECFVARNKLRC
jgi:hypothetical protein